MKIKLYIIIPFYNEEKTLPSLLHRLKTLSTYDSFNVIFCDNNSTDNSNLLIETFIEKNNTNWEIIKEPLKGTGAAADTAIRYAIHKGATHIARTDADCLPTQNWTQTIKRIFQETDIQMISGRITARRDDTNISTFKAALFNNLVPLAALFGKYRPLNRHPDNKGPYVMTAGCNMAIEKNLYLQSGGFPRTRIEDTHEDHILINAVRKITPQYKYCKEVHVKVSPRRITEWGIVNTLKWYANHSYKPKEVDIR